MYLNNANYLHQYTSSVYKLNFLAKTIEQSVYFKAYQQIVMN